MAFGDSYSEAKHDDGRVMKLTRSNSNGLTSMDVEIFSPRRRGNIRRKLLSSHNFFDLGEFDAWLAYMKERGWKFPRNVLETLVGATHWLPWYNSIMVASGHPMQP